MQLLRPLLARAAALSSVLLGAYGALAQPSDPLAAFVGHWDLVGKLVTIKIHPDRTVDHSRLGAGDIQHENVNYYQISYRHRHLRCRYEIKKYSDSELAITVAEQPSHPDCDLGEILRRAPGTKPPSSKQDKAGDAAPAGAKTSTGSVAQGPMPPFTVFKDCDTCPEMVVVPAGAFYMGSPDTEPGRLKIEGPVRKVVFGNGFAAGRHAVTRDQFNAFVAATGHQYGESCHVAVGEQWVSKSKHSFLSPPGFAQDGRHPAVCLSWNDADAYAKWLSAQTGKAYRLLTEAEREYIARAGTTTPYWWGGSIDYKQANYDTRRDTVQTGPGRLIDCPRGGTSPVQCFEPNPWGFFQVHGNVAEWTADCWNRSYKDAPTDGSAAHTGDCKRRVLRGGAWIYWPQDIRAAYREAAAAEERYFHVGFRLARDL